MSQACLLCRSEKTKSFLVRFGHCLRRCLNCDLVFLADPPSREELDQIYQKGYFTGDKNSRGYVDYEGERGNLIKNFSRRISIIKRYKRGEKLLDVGCATGIFLEGAEKEGFDPYGLDVSSYALSIARKRMPGRVFLADLLNFSSKKSFDIITMWDVLEHFLNPQKNLLKAHQLLESNGLLVLTTGNTESLWAKIAGKNWHGYLPPQHLVCFSPQTIKRILKDTGFKILDILQEGKWLSLRYIFHIAQGLTQSRVAGGLYRLLKDSPVSKRSIYLNLFDSLLVVAAKERELT